MFARSAPQAPPSPVPDASGLLSINAPPRPGKSKLLHSLGWMTGASWSTQIVCWFCTITVVRLLGPTNYGLIGMANYFVGVATILSESGLSAAVVSMPELTDEELAQLNLLSILLGCAVFGLGCLAAYPLAAFFRAPNLPHVVMAMSVVFVLSGFRNIPDGLLRRDFEFKQLATARAIETLTYGASIVAAAYSGLGYWSLVVGPLCGFSASTAFVLWRCWPRLGWPHFKRLRKSLVFSWHILVNRLGAYGYGNADNLIAGRFLGQSALGSYALAFSLANLPVQRISDQIGNVVSAYFSNVQKDEAALRQYLLRITEGMLLLVAPISIGLCLLADQLIPFAMGSQWSASILPIRLLAIYGLMCSTANLLVPLLSVRGESRFVMWCNVLAAIYLPVGFYIGSHWGIVGIAVAWPLLYPIIAVSLLRRTMREIQLSWTEYWNAIRPALIAVLVMSVVVLVLRAQISEERAIPVKLAIEIVTGAATYAAVIAGFYRDRVLQLMALRSAAPAVQ